MSTPAVGTEDLFDNIKNSSRSDDMEGHPDTWTRWFDIDTPTSGYNNGDYETVYRIQRTNKICEKDYEIAAAECYYNGDPQTTFTEDTPRKLVPDDLQRFCTTEGLVCRNDDQPYGSVCHDYSVRFRCHYNGDKDSDGNYPQFDVRIYIILAVVPIVIFLLRMLWTYVCKRRRQQRRSERRARQRLNRANGDDIDDDSSSVASGVANPPPAYHDLFGKTGHGTAGSSVFAISRDNIPICPRCARVSCSVASIIGKQRSLQNAAAIGQSAPIDNDAGPEEEIHAQRTEFTNVSQQQQTESAKEGLQQYREAEDDSENVRHSPTDTGMPVPHSSSGSIHTTISFSAPAEAACLPSAPSKAHSSPPAPKEDTSSTSAPSDEPGSLLAPTEGPSSASAPTGGPSSATPPTGGPSSATPPTEGPSSATPPTEGPSSATPPIDKPSSATPPTEGPSSPSAPKEECSSVSAPKEECSSASAPTERPSSPSVPTEGTSSSPLAIDNPSSCPARNETFNLPSPRRETPNSPSKLTQSSLSTPIKAPSSPLAAAEAHISPLAPIEAADRPLASIEVPVSPLASTQMPNSPLASTEVSNSPVTSTEVSNSPVTSTEVSNSHLASTQMPNSPLASTEVSNSPLFSTEISKSPSTHTEASNSPSVVIEAPNSHPTSNEASNSPAASLEAPSSPASIRAATPSEASPEVIIDITEADGTTDGSLSEATVLNMSSLGDPSSDAYSTLDANNIPAGGIPDQINPHSSIPETLDASASQSTSFPSSPDFTLSLNPLFLNPGDISEPCACPCHRTIPLKQGDAGYDNQGYAFEGDVEASRHPSYPGMHIPVFGFHRVWSDLSVASSNGQADLPTYDVAIELMNEKKTKEAEPQTRSN